MKRALAILASSLFVLAIGCKDYDIRLEKTLEERKYEKRLNEALQEARPRVRFKATRYSSDLRWGLRGQPRHSS